MRGRPLEKDSRPLQRAEDAENTNDSLCIQAPMRRAFLGIPRENHWDAGGRERGGGVLQRSY